MFRAALAETKVGPDPLPPQVEPLLLPVQPLLAHPDLLGLALHQDGGPALPLHSVNPPHLVHLPLQWLHEAASEVEGEVLVGLLTPLPTMGLCHMVHHPAGATPCSPLPSSPSSPPPSSTSSPPPLPEEGSVVAVVPLEAEGQGAVGLATVDPVLHLLLLHPGGLLLPDADVAGGQVPHPLPVAHAPAVLLLGSPGAELPAAGRTMEGVAPHQCLPHTPPWPLLHLGLGVGGGRAAGQGLLDGLHQLVALGGGDVDDGGGSTLPHPVGGSCLPPLLLPLLLPLLPAPVHPHRPPPVVPHGRAVPGHHPSGHQMFSTLP